MKKSVFINLSNHPSANWNAKQKEAAEALAERIIDIPFPNVPPTDDLDGVVSLVRQNLEAIDGIARWEDIVLHVAGEPTFVAQMVQHAPREATLVCSTTERVSVEKDGVKTSVFTFCQFRALR